MEPEAQGGVEHADNPNITVDDNGIEHCANCGAPSDQWEARNRMAIPPWHYDFYCGNCDAYLRRNDQ